MNARRLLKGCLVGAALAVCAWSATAQQNAADDRMNGGRSPHRCADCHICPKPTPEAQCLQPSLRDWAQRVAAARLAPEEGPRVVRLDRLERLYEAVVFDHGLHARMAEMSQGCAACHHHTPTGAAHPPCQECHTATAGETKQEMPGLKGAYHRQCMGCHREWSGQDACETCHALKGAAGAGQPRYAAGFLRECKEPERKVYETAHADGPVVTFFHKNHAQSYGLTCNECHRNESCVACHYQGQRPLAVVAAAADAMHHKCAACHDIQSPQACSKCHAAAEKPAFDHAAAAGWGLRPYHAVLTCQSCHPPGQRLARVANTCDACHADWEQGAFDHAVVGLVLDENHRENQCADCHVERRFAAPPSCEDCHDDKRSPRDTPGRPAPRKAGPRN